MKAAGTLAFRLTAVSFVLSLLDLLVILVIMNAQMASLGAGPHGAPHGVHSSLLWIGMLLVAVSAGANFVVFKRVSRPLKRLALAAGEIASGRFGATVPEESGFSDIASLWRAFNTMSSTLGRNEDNRRKLFAGIAHELRTPLAVVDGNLEAVVDDVMEPSKDRLLMMQDEIARAIRLVGDLRDLSLAEAGRLRLEIRKTDMVAMLRQAAELMEPMASEQGMRFALDLGCFPVERPVDPDRMRQVFANIFSNSIRCSGGSVISVEIERLEDGRIEVRISDDGRGIVDEERKSVFEYFRTGRASPRGSGIGLALARQYVLTHGGTISCLEAQGGGTCFAIVI